MKTNAPIEMDILIKMLEAETRAEKNRYASEVHGSLSSACDNFDALGPLILKQKISNRKLVFTADIPYSRFRAGDSVEIRVQKFNSDLSDNFSYNWVVKEVSSPAPGKLEIVISSDMPVEIDNRREYFLFSSYSAGFNNSLIKKMIDMSRPGNEIILGRQTYNLAYQDPKFRAFYEDLNFSQREAIDYLYDHNLSGAVQGPPGTGKTQLLRAIVSLAMQSNMKVCIASFTNAAVDNLLSRVVNSNFEYDWLRMGKAEKVVSKLYLNDSLNGHSEESFGAFASEVNLMGSTLHKLALNSKAPKFDLLLIDEAGQVPIYFWPFIQRLAKRVVFVGDQFQLPPVLKEQHRDVPFDNVFSAVIGSDTRMLETQYRMRKEIQAWSSEKFYKGKLIAHSSVADRDFFNGSTAFGGDGFVVPRKMNSLGSNSSSIQEANFITEKVERLFQSNVDLQKVGVICPYRFQAGAVNVALQNRLGVENASKVLIDTVERFQGQEKEAIFLSFGASGYDQGQLKFLSDPKRLNVSVTRAKSRFYCLFDNDLWEQSRLPQYEDLNEFLRWVTHGKTSIRKAA